MHTDKNGVCNSEAVGVLLERYIQLCEEQNVDPNRAPIHTWAEAVGVRKNGITGVPRTKASNILPIKRSRKRRRGCDDNESGARSVFHHMADDTVIQTVDQTIAYARAHPHEFGLAPEQVTMLAKSIVMAEGEVELPSNHPLSMGTMTELVQAMLSVLTDIQARSKPSNSNKDKGKSIMREDDGLSGSHGDDIPI